MTCKTQRVQIPPKTGNACTVEDAEVPHYSIIGKSVFNIYYIIKYVCVKDMHANKLVLILLLRWPDEMQRSGKNGFRSKELRCKRFIFVRVMKMADVSLKVGNSKARS